jgi:hypothetical protein
MSQQELLTHVVSTLNSCGIDYMLTGSVASSVQGEPRTSHDIDIVLQVRQSAVPALIQAFSPPRFYLTKESITDAILHQGMFNVIDVSGGDKIDFWILTDEPFDQSRFARKLRQLLFGIDVCISTPEDTIIQKLYWAKKSGGSEKQFTDALRVYELQYALLDMTYISRWVKTLHIEEMWTTLRKKADPIA